MEMSTSEGRQAVIWSCGSLSSRDSEELSLCNTLHSQERDQSQILIVSAIDHKKIVLYLEVVTIQ